MAAMTIEFDELPERLAEVQETLDSGDAVRLTRSDRPFARLVPAGGRRSARRKAVDDLLALPPIDFGHPLTTDEVSAMIAEGREEGKSY